MQWHKPSWFEELGEFKRVSSSLSISLLRLFFLFLTGRMERLDRPDWSSLENTDSWDTTTFALVEEQVQHSGRDVGRILQAFEGSGSLPAPIILRSDGKTHLVAGNTRLMVCRALDETPQVWIVGDHAP